MRGAIVALCALLAVAGCELDTKDAPACRAGMPSAPDFLPDPAFRSFTYHKRVQYEIRRGLGYDLWGDSRFEYRMGLEFALVPVKGGRSDDDLCVQGAALRLALPPAPGADGALQTFARIAASRTGMDGPAVAAQLAERFASGAKYQLVARKGAITVDAGRVSHPVRGEFFVVAFSWAD